MVFEPDAAHLLLDATPMIAPRDIVSSNVGVVVPSVESNNSSPSKKRI